MDLFYGCRLILNYRLPTTKEDRSAQREIERKVISAVLARHECKTWYSWRYYEGETPHLAMYVHYKRKQAIYAKTYEYLGMRPQMTRIMDSEAFFKKMKKVTTENIAYEKGFFKYVKEKPRSRILQRLRETMYKQQKATTYKETVDYYYEPNKALGLRDPCIDPASVKRAWDQIRTEREEQIWAKRKEGKGQKTYFTEEFKNTIANFFIITYIAGILWVSLR